MYHAAQFNCYCHLTHVALLVRYARVIELTESNVLLLGGIQPLQDFEYKARGFGTVRDKSRFLGRECNAQMSAPWLDRRGAAASAQCAAWHPSTDYSPPKD